MSDGNVKHFAEFYRLCNLSAGCAGVDSKVVWSEVTSLFDLDLEITDVNETLKIFWRFFHMTLKIFCRDRSRALIFSLKILPYWSYFVICFICFLGWSIHLCLLLRSFQFLIVCLVSKNYYCRFANHEDLIWN